MGPAGLHSVHSRVPTNRRQALRALPALPVEAVEPGPAVEETGSTSCLARTSIGVVAVAGVAAADVELLARSTGPVVADRSA